MFAHYVQIKERTVIYHFAPQSLLAVLYQKAVNESEYPKLVQ
ncbi:hypothetical protein PLUTE_a0431 [Pseudoalteromonas luteoviolacea DSM 6061]|nr:hypothetical protein [Pseudoalteromonas luteoviolacea DSM 6061]